MAVIVHMAVGLAEPHDRLVRAAQAGEGQLGRRDVRHDVAVAGDQEGGRRDLAQHRRVIDRAVGREHVTVLEIRGELAESARPGILERVAVEARDGEPVDIFVRVIESIDHFHAGDPDKRQRSAQPARDWRPATRAGALGWPGACRSEGSPPE